MKECLGLKQPVESEEERNSKAVEWAESLRLNASVSQVVRRSDRSGKRVCFSKGLPEDRQGNYMCGHDDGRSRKQIQWEHDPHKLMVCDMKGFVDKVVEDRFGACGHAVDEDRVLFEKLVKEERDRDKTKYPEARKPFRARAGLRLIMMLISILP